MPLFSDSPLFEAQATRVLYHALHGAADFGECFATMQRVPAGDADAWGREWTATADRVAGIGDDCARQGHPASAAAAYLRAANYYRAAYTMLYGRPVSSALAAAFDREAATFGKFAAATDVPITPVEIPYAGTTLPGLFCRGGEGMRPLLVCTNGYDATMYEMYVAFAIDARRRGWHCLLFDGPGQGRVLFRQGIAMRPDWENVVRPVLDFALTLPDVDRGRVALSGWSLGGFLALRGARGESRLAALVADPALPGMAPMIRKMFAALPPQALADPLAADPAVFAPYAAHIEADPDTRWRIVQRGYMVQGVDSLPAFVAAALTYDATSTLAEIRCPVFLGYEESDPLAAGAPQVAAALGDKATLVRFTAAEGADEHCAGNGRALFAQRMFDWLDETVGKG